MKDATLAGREAVYENPFYTPPGELLEELRACKRRGEDRGATSPG